MTTEPFEQAPAKRDIESQSEDALPTLARKASLNSIASTLDYGARILVSFVVKPILVAGLGAWGYGAWELLNRLAGYVGPATGRAGHALRSTVAKQQHSQDYQMKRRAVGSAVAVWFALTPIAGLVTIVLVWQAPSWLNAPPEYVWPVRIAALLLGANVILTQLTDLSRCILEGENLGYKRMGISALLVACGGLMSVVAVRSGFGIIGVAGAMLGTSVLTGLLYLRVAYSQVSWFGILAPKWQDVAAFFRLSGWFLGWNTIFKLMRASDVVVLGMLASVELVGNYTLTKYAPEVGINLIAIVVFGIAPGLGGILGKGDFKLAAQIRAEILALTWLITTIVAAATVMWNEPFLNLWVGSAYHAGSTATLLIVLMVVQFVLIRSEANIISLTLNLRAKVVLGVIAAALSVLLSILFVGLFDMGISGLCIGTMAGRLIQSIGYPWIMSKYLGVAFRGQLAGALRPALVMVAVLLAAMEIGSWFTPTNWTTLVFCIATTVLVLPLPLFFLGLNSPVRAGLQQRLEHILWR